MFIYEFRCSNYATQHVEFVYVVAKNAEAAYNKITLSYKDYEKMMTGKISKLGRDWDVLESQNH